MVRRRKWLPSRIKILHTCDTPSCVRPRHLFSGTQRDNILDAVNKGRIARGRRSGAWKRERTILSPADVIAIRRRFYAGDNRREMAMEFGVDRSQIYRAAKEESWAWVEERDAG